MSYKELYDYVVYISKKVGKNSRIADYNFEMFLNYGEDDFIISIGSMDVSLNIFLTSDEKLKIISYLDIEIGKESIIIEYSPEDTEEILTLTHGRFKDVLKHLPMEDFKNCIENGYHSYV